MVQNFRLNLKVGHEKLGGVLRADAAQGWWGANNDPNTGVDADGNPTYNPGAYFRNKDNNYPIHFDHAFIYFELPWFPVRFELGRNTWHVGNKLVLDYPLDGITLSSSVGDHVKLSAMWAKISEGNGSYKTPAGALMNDDDQWSDSDLMGLQVKYGTKTFNAELFGLFYKDRMDRMDEADGGAHLPQGLGFEYSRFQPQVSQAIALGLALDGSADIAKGLKWGFEFDFLTGDDDFDNADHAGGLLDKNDGSLSGFNALAHATQKLDVGVPFDIGLVVGMGSGDDDPTEGGGNLNRIITMGRWPLTNVWEDSVMPDIGGISPQGLGSPVSRGYRELENTTVAQLKLGLVPTERLRLEASYTYLEATQDVHGWDAMGVPTDETASDLGMEIDVNLKLTIYEELKYIVLFGYFMPGDAAALLMNGNTDKTEAAMEVKQVLLYKF